MGVTVQVRNLDPEVQEILKAQARAKGLSFSEYLRRALTNIAERERIHQRWDEAVAESERRLAEPGKARKPMHIDREVLLRALHEGREER